MHRTQLLLEDWQYEALKARAERSGRSLSDIVREILAAHLNARPKPKDDPLLLMDSVFEDGGGAGVDHDAYLYRKPKE